MIFNVRNLNLIHPLPDWTYIMTVKNHLATKLIPVLIDVVVLYHDDYHIDFIQKLVKIKNLVRQNGLVGEEGIEAL